MTLSTTVPDGKFLREVCAVKNSSEDLTESNIRRNVLFLPIVRSALHSFYLSLRNVYSPKLADGQNLDTKTIQALAEVESGIHRALVQVHSLLSWFSPVVWSLAV